MHVGIEAFAAYGHVGVVELARTVEEAGLESLFLVHYIHLTGRTVAEARNVHAQAGVEVRDLERPAGGADHGPALAGSGPAQLLRDGVARHRRSNAL
jgi:hypothetical protein